MSPSKVDRDTVRLLTDLPNVGKVIATDLRLLGIREPQELLGQDPLTMYERLCRITGRRQDPCVADVFISITRFMDGEPPSPWWKFSTLRKQMLGERTKR